MSDADSIAAGFDAVAQRWGELNSLVHTIGPGDGYFEEMNDEQWDETFALGTMSGVRSIRAALPMLRAAEWARIVTLSAHSIQRQNPRIVAYTASKAALTQRHQEPVEKPCQRRHPGQLRLPGNHSHGELHREPEGHPRRRRAGCRPIPRDVMTWIDNNFHQPCDLGRAGLPEEIASITAYSGVEAQWLCHRGDRQRRRRFGFRLTLSGGSSRPE